MADDLGEKTEDATPKRKEQAREKGQVAKSTDLASVVVLVAGSLALFFFFRPMLGDMKMMMERILSDTFGDPTDPDSALIAMYDAGAASLRIGAPVIIIVWLAAAVSHVMQVGLMLSPKAIQPSLGKLNPLSGFKRIFGLSGVVKAGLDAVKVAAVCAVAVWTITGYKTEIATLLYLEPWAATAAIGWIMFDLAARILALLLILGIADFAYQKWKHAKDLKMSKQEVKDEMKSAEGDPEVKRRRMRMAQGIAMQRISAAVPQADVIVTNPEHLSVAIQYDPEQMNAPTVVAKGADFLALRIRQIAAQHDIPIVERKPLARALYKQVEVGQEVPAQFYQAIAEVLAYVYRLSGKVA